MAPSNIPTNNLVAWLSVGLPSKLTFKDKVGPKLVAIVGESEEGEGVGAGIVSATEEAEEFNMVLVAEEVAVGGAFLTTGPSEARLLVV